MMKLLSANFFSMIRSKRFWLGCVFMAGFAGLNIWSRQRQAGEGLDLAIDSEIMSFAPLLFLILPCLCGLYINTDYHDGTIRNKLTVGRSRTAVYLSNFIIVYAVGLFYSALYVGTTLIGGIGLDVKDPLEVLISSGMMLLTILALTAVSVFLATMIANRYVLSLCAVLAIGMMFGSAMINDMLESPDTMPDIEVVSYSVGEDGMMIPKYVDSRGNEYTMDDDIPMVPNPNYIDEPLRTILRKYNDVSPGGQIWEIMNEGHTDWDKEAQTQVLEQTPYWQLALYSLCVTAGSTVLGTALFRRKDLK